MGVIRTLSPRSAWSAAHVRADGVPDWAWTAALAIPLTVLPSSIWRIAIGTFHLPISDGDQGDGDGWSPHGAKCSRAGSQDCAAGACRRSPQ